MKRYLKMFAAAWSGGSKKKIILSLSVIGIVCAIAIGVTVSYFSDTETSTGNKFVAGKLNLQIDNTCHYNGMICTENEVWAEESTGSAAEPDMVGTPCECTWSAKDLTNELFFNLLDVKPGDEGEDTVSLHVDNNDAWVCAEIANLVKDDNGCDSPENKLDQTCGAGQGELQDNLFFTIWKDDNCDNILDSETGIPGSCAPTPRLENDCVGRIQNDCLSEEGCLWTEFSPEGPTCYNNPSFVANCDGLPEQDCSPERVCQWIPGTPGTPGEQVLVDNQKATSMFWPIADSTTGSGPIPGDETYCLGIAWNVPIETSNIIQTDSLVGDVIFNAVQSRNMPNFKCSDLYTEVCGDQKDNDYDGLIDEDCIVCGDGVIGGTEACELPGTSDNSLCAQSPWQCVGQKIETRDSYGVCGASCGCSEDPWGPLSCSLRCGAGCETDHECEDNNPATTDTCNLTSCGCENVCIPSTEVCDGLDNDCDGTIDEGCQTYQLSVSNVGGGKVMGSGIDCGTDCTESFSANSQVTLTTLPYSNAIFRGWSGACSGTSSCTITMNMAKNVGASFAYPLQIAKTGSGTGSVTSVPAGINCGATCSNYFSYLQIVSLTATPSADSIFTGWSSPCSGTGSCPISVNMLTNVTANFDLK